MAYCLPFLVWFLFCLIPAHIHRPENSQKSAKSLYARARPPRSSMVESGLTDLYPARLSIPLPRRAPKPPPPQKGKGIHGIDTRPFRFGNSIQFLLSGKSV